MTTLDRATKERQRAARSRAGHIRYGMQNLKETFAHIARARAENDHQTLGYETWQEYVDGEFGAERLKLSPDKRREYVELLALAGASQREISHTVGVNQSTVSRDLAAGDAPASPDEIYDRDGNLVPPADSPLVDAMKQAINDAEERAEDHREWSPGEPDATASGADDLSPSAAPGVAASAAPGASGSVTSPTGPDTQERTEEKCPTCGQRWPRHPEE